MMFVHIETDEERTYRHMQKELNYLYERIDRLESERLWIFMMGMLVSVIIGFMAI